MLGGMVGDSKGPRGSAALIGLASFAALVIGVMPLVGLPCERCTGGLLAALLPWLGVVIYGALSGAAFRRPEAPWIGSGLAAAVFVHADLVVESIVLRRLCWGCFGVAGLILAAAGVRIRAMPSERTAVFAGCLLGALASLFSPFDRADFALTRHFWPARILKEVPQVVDRAELQGCSHGAPIRLLLYEKDCKG